MYSLYTIVAVIFLTLTTFGFAPNMMRDGMTFQDCVRASDEVSHMSWVWCEVDEEVDSAPSTDDSLNGRTQDETKAPEEEPQAL
jgi:hypothetical protein